MEEKVLTGKKHGMLALFGIMVLYLLAVVGFVYGLYMNDENPVLIFSVITLIVFASVLLSGLKVLKTTRSVGFDAVWTICGYFERRWFLFCQSVLHQCESCCKDKIRTKWGCE